MFWSTPLGLASYSHFLTPGRVQLPAVTVLDRGLFIGEPRWGSVWIEARVVIFLNKSFKRYRQQTNEANLNEG